MTGAKQIVVCLALSVSCVFGASTVPFTDGFESYTNGTTFLIENNGWQASTNAVIVQTNNVNAGAKAVVIPSDGVLSNNVTDPVVNNLWVDQYVYPAPGEPPVSATDSDVSLRLYFDASGYINIATNGGWDVCSNDIYNVSVTPATSGWVRLAFRYDYSGSNVSVVLNNQILRQQVPFIGTSSGFNELIYDHGSDGGSVTVTNTYVDDISISTNLPANLAPELDGDHDGVADVKELDLYGSTTNRGGGAIVAQSLPFDDDLEYYVNGGSFQLMGEYGWGASSSDDIVSTNSVNGGNNAALIADATSVSNYISTTETHIWGDWYVKPRLGAQPTNSPASNESFHLYFNTNGYVVVATNGGWDVCTTDVFGNAVSPVSNDFVRLTVLSDYTDKKVAILLDGVVLREEVSFVGASASAFHGITYRNDIIGDDSYVDDILIATNLPSGLNNDLDNDGMNDAEELDTYGSTTNYHLPTITVVTNLVNSSGPGGTITPDGTFSMPWGGSTTIVMNANAGWRVTDVQTNGVSVSFTGDNTASASYALTNAQSDITLTVELTYTIGLPLTAQGMPFEDDLEDYINGRRIVDLGNYGWSASATSAVVQSSIVNGGSKAVDIPDGIAVSNSISTTETAIWFDWYVKPELGDEPDSSPGTDESVHLFFNTNGYVEVATNGGWEICDTDNVGSSVTPVSNNWIRLTLFQDYTAKKAAVLLNGHVIKEELPFIGASATALNSVIYRNVGGHTNSYVDDVLITTNLASLSLPAVDADNDGMNDAEEIAQYGNTTNYHLPIISVVVSNVNAAGPGGTVTPNGTFEMGWGSDTNFAMNAVSGWRVTDVLTNGVSVPFTGDNSASASYALTNVQSDVEVTVEFTYIVGLPLVPQGLPFDDDLEDYTNGDLLDNLGHYGWTASGSTAIVETNEVHAGNNAAIIAKGTSASNHIDTTETHIWSDWYIKPALGVAPDSSPATNECFHLYFNTNGYVAVATNGGWDVCDIDVFGNAVTPVSNNWIRLSILKDYDNSRVAIILNGVVIREEVPFIGIGATSFHGIGYQNLSVENQAYVDDILIDTNTPANLNMDLDNDGMADAEEIDAYGNVLTYPPKGTLFKFK